MSCSGDDYIDSWLDAVNSWAVNNLGEAFTVRVRTGFRNRTLKPLAWRGRDSVMSPGSAATDGDGWCHVEAPPRGYTVYGP